MTIHKILSRSGYEFRTLFACIAISTLLWLVHAMNAYYITEVSMPLVLPTGATRQYVFVPAEIELNVSSSGWTLFKHHFYIHETSITIDPQRLRSGLITGDRLTRLIATKGIKGYKINYMITDTLTIKRK